MHILHRGISKLFLIVPAALLVGLQAFTLHAQTPETQSPFSQKIQAAMASDIRSAEERARDANRKPVETLEFFGITDNMRVLELFPGAGWYTKLLAPALADNGQLYTAFTTSRIQPVIAENKTLNAVQHLDFEPDFQPTAIRGIFELKGYTLDVKDLDAVLTFRNYHNLAADSRSWLNQQVFAALKSGGIYGIVDHTQRHNAPITQEQFRRFDPVLAIKEVQAAGFVLVDFSDLHYRPDDSLQFDTQRATVKENSDRFTLLFRKP